VQAQSRGFTIHYEVCGTGPPLVLVPGTLSSAAQWEMFGYVGALRETHRVISVDPLGHGRSDKPHDPDTYLAGGVTADLVAVLDAEDLDRVTVWGYSRGGWLTCRLAADHPERVQRIVVGGYASHAHRAERPRQSAWIEHLARGDWAGFWRTWGIDDPGPLAPIEAANDPLAIAAAVAGSQRPDRYVDLEAIGCPSFHYAGEADPVATHVRADAQALRAPVEVFAAASHLSAFADARPALDVVPTWLQAAGGAS
jgi:pimeloyl-ACP methyl ester carboxylesterase